MFRRFLFLSLAVALALAAIALPACSPDRVDQDRERSIEIRRDEYGDAWPLTVRSVTLHCWRHAVWVELGAWSYPVNGTAKGMFSGHPRAGPIEDIWREGTVWPRVSLGPLIDDGLALC